MSEYTSDRMPDGMSEYMSDRMPDIMSEYASDRTSVGGDHSKKVILCYVVLSCLVLFCFVCQHLGPLSSLHTSTSSLLSNLIPFQLSPSVRWVLKMA